MKQFIFNKGVDVISGNYTWFLNTHRKLSDNDDMPFMKRLLLKNDYICSKEKQDSWFVLNLSNSLLTTPQTAKYERVSWNWKLCWSFDGSKHHKARRKKMVMYRYPVSNLQMKCVPEADLGLLQHPRWSALW